MIEIQVNGLVKSFEVGRNVLDGLTFQIDQGERVGLLGRNGAGKTTLFKMVKVTLFRNIRRFHCRKARPCLSARNIRPALYQAP